MNLPYLYVPRARAASTQVSDEEPRPVRACVGWVSRIVLRLHLACTISVATIYIKRHHIKVQRII